MTASPQPPTVVARCGPARPRLDLPRRSARLAQLVERFGGAGNTLKAIYNAAKGFIDGNIGRYITSGQRLALALLASVGLDLIGDALGIGGCVSLVKEVL